MKRLLIFAALLSLAGVANAARGLVIIPRAPTESVGGGGGVLEVESVGTNHISSGVVTTASMTYTTTADTDMIVLGIAWRRNSGQGVSSINWTVAGGSAEPLSQITDTTSPSAQKRTQLYFLRNPGVGTGNINVTMTEAVPGLGFAAANISGTNSDPINGDAQAASVTTSSATATTTVGDILITVMTKQDPSTSEPTLNTSGAVLQKDFDYSSGGNGGHFKFTTQVADATSETINYSWTTAANHAHSHGVITP